MSHTRIPRVANATNNVTISRQRNTNDIATNTNDIATNTAGITALDTRVTKGAAICGSLPYYLTQAVPVTRDFEQQLIGLIGSVDYADLFLMACTGGRKYKKYLNTLDPKAKKIFIPFLLGVLLVF